MWKQAWVAALRGGSKGAPTPIVGEKFGLKVRSQNLSMSEVLPTVELPRRSSFNSFVLSSELAAILPAAPAAAPAPAGEREHPPAVCRHLTFHFCTPTD